MQLLKNYQNVICVYKIICKPNGKVLIGSTTNLYARINHYRTDKNKANPLKHYNSKLYADILKYGIEAFDVEVIEEFKDISNIELKNKETYYMNLFNSLDDNIGYNIRQDIDGHCICADSTREIKRKQAIEQWNSGIRNGHSKKMKNYWDNNISRKLQQSSIMSANKTKYVYSVYNKDTNVLIENLSYNNLYIPGYNSMQILQKFCYVNRKARNKKRGKSENVIFCPIINEISIGSYIISRTKV